MQGSVSRYVLGRGGAQGRAAAVEHIAHAAGEQYRQRDTLIVRT
ncbi:MAG: hypothetical protein NZ610_07975 [Candidatus Bipolaricaulota bacterium]|nr:hypothetical protein [Candidatus Bipolaricaulota bacterium]MCS7275314.1 hypothetical protein [Candidatus Bipolaricaulota bacterium]MDW8110187.1 hypothetical protein [Candidatus Bipolaricaulota bacterium]